MLPHRRQKTADTRGEVRAQLSYPLATAAFVKAAESVLASNVAFDYQGAYPRQLAHGLGEIAAENGVVTRAAIRDLAGNRSELTRKAIDLVGARTTPKALAHLLAPSFFDIFFGPGPGSGSEGSLAAWGAQLGAGLVPG